MLHRHLHSVESERCKLRKPLEGQRDPARDQVRIQLKLVRSLNELFKVTPQQRLSPCQVEVDDTQGFRLLEDAKPCVGIDLISVTGMAEGV